MKTIRQSLLARAWGRRSRVGDIVIFDVLGAAPRGSGATEAAAREDVRRVAQSLRAPHEDFNGEAFLVLPPNGRGILCSNVCGYNSGIRKRTDWRHHHAWNSKPEIRLGRNREILSPARRAVTKRW